MNDSLITFAFEMANFVALAAVLAWLFFKPVRRAIEAQRAEASRKDEEAAQKVADAERLRQDIESQRRTLATELEAMRIKARDAAKQDAERVVAEAREQMDRERATLKRDALRIEKAQTARIARAVAAATNCAVKRFLEQIEGPDLEQTLIKAACHQLQTLSTNSLAPVTVESATLLDEESQTLIKTALGAAAKTANFRVVPDLKGGLRISTAHGLIDASIKGLAAFAEQSLSAEMESMIREESEGA